MLTEPASSSSVLALVTTIHLGLAAVRNHRGLTSVSSLAVISFLLGGLPWVMPSPLGLGLGLVVHATWFGVCELLVPASRQSAASASRAVRPASDARPSKAAPASAATLPLIIAPGGAPGGTTAARAGKAAPAPPPNKGFIQVPVLAIFDESSTIKTIRVSRPDGFDFEAGQFLTLRVRVDGREHARCYSISSAPDVRGYLEVSIKKQGLVSNALHASIRPGAMIWIKRPLGAFKYPAGDDRPIVLLAGGIGVTPLLSMLRHAVSTEPARPVTLIYSSHSEQDFAFRDELSAAARRHPQLRVYLAASKGSDKPYIYSGRIDESLLRTTVPDVVHSVAYICGPEPMIEGMKTLLAKMGMPPAQIRYEMFQAAVAASASHAREQTDEHVPALHSVGASAVGGLQTQAAATTARRAVASGHSMICVKSRKQITVPAGQTLLESAEEAGVAIESLCRAGVCGTCRVQITDGDVECDSTSLDADEVSSGVVLACVSTAKSDCTVNV